jgi:hypothetical protein
MSSFSRESLLLNHYRRGKICKDCEALLFINLLPELIFSESMIEILNHCGSGKMCKDCKA